MENIKAILKRFGLEVTDEQMKDIEKAVAENYKTIKEHTDKVTKLTSEKENFEKMYTEANETMKKFDGVDVEEMKKASEDYKKKLSEIEDNYKKEIYQRDFDSALEKSISNYKFTSEYAKKGIIDEIKSSNLPLKDGNLLGLDDLVKLLKEKDTSAFIDEETQNLEQNKARFGEGVKGQKDGRKMSMSELMKMKNENPSFDVSAYIGKE